MLMDERAGHIEADRLGQGHAERFVFNGAVQIFNGRLDNIVTGSGAKPETELLLVVMDRKLLLSAGQRQTNTFLPGQQGPFRKFRANGV